MYRYQQATVEQAAKIMAAMGLPARRPSCTPHQLRRNIDAHARTAPTPSIYEWLEPGQLLAEPPAGLGRRLGRRPTPTPSASATAEELTA